MKPKKLIRSKIPYKLKPGEWEIIKDTEELNKLYALKIHEELIEVQKSEHKDVYELADLLEVTLAFAFLNGFSYDHVITAIKQKMNSNGGFENIVLTNLNPNNPSNEIYFEALD